MPPEDDWFTAGTTSTPPQPSLGRRQAEAATVKGEAQAAVAQEDVARQPIERRKAEVELEQAEIDLAESRRKLDEAQQKGPFYEAQLADDQRKVLDDIAEMRRLVRGGMATGPVGQFTGNLYGSPAATVWGEGGLRDAVTAPRVMTELLSSREGSAAGATPFGQLALREMELVRSLGGALAESLSAEQTLRALDQYEQGYRRAFAYAMGIDPRTEAGAAYVGLQYDPSIDPERNPRGAAQYDASVLGVDEAPFVYRQPPGEDDDATPPPTSGGAVERGEWVSDPNLLGVDAAVTGLIRQGIASNLSDADIEANVRGYLDSVQPGLGARARELGPNIRYAREQERDPRVTIERSYRSGGEKPGFGETAVIGAADVISGGFLDELTGKGAEMQALQAERPRAYLVGQLGGGAVSSLIPNALLTRYGIQTPLMMQGLGQNVFYGVGSADEGLGNRLAGGAVGAFATPVGNLVGQAPSRLVGSLLRGTEDEGARLLANKYGVELTPGSTTPGGMMQWLENRIADVPVARNLVGNRRQESIRSFNEAAFDTALAPINGSTQGVVGRQGVEAANRQIDDAYKQALESVEIKVDPADVFDDSWLVGVTGPAAESARRQLATMRSNLVDANGKMSGSKIQKAKQDLQTLRTDLANAEGIERDLVSRVDELQDRLYDAFEQQAPENYSLFLNADRAYGNLQTVQNAVLMSPSSMIDPQAGRLFEPAALGRQARQGDIRYRGRRAAASGEGTFAEMTDAAERLVRPDREGSLTRTLASGTAIGLPTAAYMLAPSTSGGEGEGGVGAEQQSGAVPAWAAYSTLAAPLVSLPFTRRGSRGYQSLMTSERGPFSRGLGELLQKYIAPATAAGITRPAIGEIVEPIYPEPVSVRSDLVGPIRPESAYFSAPSAPAQPEAPSTAQTGIVSINGRLAQYDPEADVYIDVETGEVVNEGYKRGGRAMRRPARARALRR